MSLKPYNYQDRHILCKFQKITKRKMYRIFKKRTMKSLPTRSFPLYSPHSFSLSLLLLFIILMILFITSICPLGYVFYLLYSNYTHVYKKIKSMHKEIQAQNTPECQEPIQLELISGKIPTWLNGAMYRIGKHISIYFFFFKSKLTVT